jgi:hypothetical protein
MRIGVPMGTLERRVRSSRAVRSGEDLEPELADGVGARHAAPAGERRTVRGGEARAAGADDRQFVLAV